MGDGGYCRDTDFIADISNAEVVISKIKPNICLINITDNISKIKTNI